MSSLPDQNSARVIAGAIAQGQASCVGVIEDTLRRIDRLDRNPGELRDIAAFLEVDSDGALARARQIDERRARGEPLGRLAGVPVALKDNLCVSGWRTTCASRMLENFRPPYNAHVVERLLAEDAIPVGRANMDEFAMGSTCESSAFAITRNPRDLDRSPGGSSGGSAAAVASGCVPIALGSDTGGSIRQPAAFCGVVGLKPTYGRVSRYGLVAYASSLDQIGPLANTVSDAALLLEVISGHDRRDSTSVDVPVPSYLESLEQPLTGLRIGIVQEHFSDGLDPEVAAAVRGAVDIYQNLGAQVVELSLPHSQYSIATYYIVASSEASSNLARYDGVHYGHRAGTFDGLVDMYRTSRGEGFGDEVKRRIMLGTYALSSGYYDAYYNKALKVRRLIRQDFDRAFEQVDVIASPVAPTPAFRIGDMSDDPLTMYLSDVYTLSANLAGIPALSLPCGWSRSGLPIGLQLAAPPFAEERLLRAGRMLEKARSDG